MDLNTIKSKGSRRFYEVERHTFSRSVARTPKSIKPFILQGPRSFNNYSTTIQLFLFLLERSNLIHNWSSPAKGNFFPLAYIICNLRILFLFFKIFFKILQEIQGEIVCHLFTFRQSSITKTNLIILGSDSILIEPNLGFFTGFLLG